MNGHEKGPITQIDGNVKTQWVSWVASCLTMDLKRTDDNKKHKCNYIGALALVWCCFHLQLPQ